jgi:hypothetical protein
MSARVALAGGCVLLAYGLVVNSALGPLAAGVIEYRYTDTFESQGIGLDAFLLVIAVPLLFLAAALASRRETAAGLIAFGPAAMAAYMMPQYVLGARYDSIEGNNEDFFLLHLGIFAMGVAVAIVAWKALEPRCLPDATPRFRRWTGALMCAVAAFLVLRYAPSLLAIWSHDPPDQYVEDPIAFWLIAFMDLGIVLPAATATGIALFRGVADARRPMYAIVAWFALVGPAVAAMSFAMEVRDDQYASLAGAVAFTVFGAVFAAMAVVLFRPVVAGIDRARINAGCGGK